MNQIMLHMNPINIRLLMPDAPHVIEDVEHPDEAVAVRDDELLRQQAEYDLGQ